VVDNGTTNRIPLWKDEFGGDVNHPRAEQRMYQSDLDNIYTRELTLENGSSVAVYAESYKCYAENDYFPNEDNINDIESVYEHPNRFSDGDSIWGMPCTLESDSERINISSNSNSENVKILSDGDEIATPVPGDPNQLTVSQMLGASQTDDSNRLQLRDGERIFMYELSDDGATYQDALNRPSGQSDPDYNDAIVRFQVTNATETVTPPSDLKITDYDVPARVDSGNDAQLSLTVGNDGGQTATSAIQVTFDGNTKTIDTVTLDGGETTTVTTILDTGSKSAGNNYQWTANVTAAERAERNGFVYVGQPTRPFFQVTGVNGPSVVDSDDSPEAAINITNSGSEDDTQQVTLTAEADDGRTWTDSTMLAVDAKQTEDTTLSLPDSRGNWTYNVSTDNVTTGELDLFVGQSDVYVSETGGVNIGLQEYNTSSLIEREGGIEAMTFELRNDGTVGDEREVELNLRYDNGTEVDGFPDSTTKQIGNGDLTGLGPVPAYVTFDSVDLDPGYYEYELVVYNDTAGDGVDDRVSGELYLRELFSGDSDSETPITIDSGTITFD